MLNVLEILRTPRKQDPEVLAAAIVEVEAKLPALEQEFQAVEKTLIEKEQVGILGGSVSSEELEVLMKRRDQADRRVKAARQTIAQLKDCMVRSVEERFRSAEEEKDRLESLLAKGREKLIAEMFEKYIELSVIYSAYHGIPIADKFWSSPLFDTSRGIEFESQVRERFAAIASKGPMGEHLKTLKRRDEVRSILSQKDTAQIEEVIEGLVIRAREKSSAN